MATGKTNNFFGSQERAPILVAHRAGAGSNKHLENSLEAFTRGVKRGYRYFESDFHATKDGRVFAYHGAVKELIFGVFKHFDIEKLHSADVRSVRSGGSSVIPELSDILEELPQDRRLFTEIKHQPAVEPLAKELVRTQAVGRVSIISFFEPWTHKVASEIYKQTGGEEVSTGMLVGTVFGAAALKARLMLGGHGAAPYDEVLLHHKLVTPEIVSSIHNANMKVLPWTVNGLDDGRYVLDAGADGFLSDYPDKLNVVLGERGQ